MVEIWVEDENEANRVSEAIVEAFAKHYAFEVERIMVRRLHEAGPPHGTPISLTGDLANSIHVVHSGGKWRVVIDSEYADYVEYGTRPHWMPVAAALRYARLRGKPDSFAFAMRAKVAKEGTKAHPFIEPAMIEAAEPALVKALLEVVGRA